MRPIDKARTPAPAQEDSGSTLLLMLVGGLVLVVVGALVIMQFV